MKKNFLPLTIIFLSFSVNLLSQTFTVTINSPNPHYVPMDSCANVTSDFSINNQSNNLISIRLIRINVNVPNGWITAICDEHFCYPPTLDTTLWQTYTPGNHPALSAHFYDTNNTAGSGSFTIIAVMQGSSESHSVTFEVVVWPVGVKPISMNASEFKLKQNYPNPFNPSTIIRFSIPNISPHLNQGGQGGFTSLKIYDILGREVAVLVNQNLQQGNYEVEWDAKNLSSGIYYYKLSTPNDVAVKKMVLVK